MALKRCDEISIEVPAQGVIAAKSLCRFGQLISPEIFAMATAVKGSAYRVLGRFDESRESYEKSLEIASKPTVVRGRILQRFAVLEFDLVKNATARKRINESLELLESEEDTAISLIIRANIDLADGQYLECLQSAGFALRSLNPKHHQRAYLAGVQVLGRGILAGGASSEDISAICRLIQELKRNRPRRRSVCWLYLDLVEAQIYARLGSHRQAERQFLRVRERLFEAGGEHFREGLLVSLDLAVLYEDC
ncbi:hypothetical protein AC249_AIPGENE21919, partial [Exaiptasia diaphana]